ncbi:hypothetical protein CO218_14945 [Lactiplantibacillus plantarum]|nr:hypothetical protein CO218_14945 [Lactiplantibacillus plantarum]QBJ55345.1 hypothetical protein C3O83_04590 [Lactiplantibacillus plantarum]
MDCVVTPLKTLMGFSVHLNVQFKFYNLPLCFLSYFNNVKEYLSRGHSVKFRNDAVTIPVTNIN